MRIKFTEHDHKYTSHFNDDSDSILDNIDWISVTTFIGRFKDPFDSKAMAERCSKRKPTPLRPNKWYGIPPEKILEIWDRENKRSTDIGSLYHYIREHGVRSKPFLLRNGKEYKVYEPDDKTDAKYSLDQKLSEGIYPEHIVYMKSAGIVGQADRFEVIGDVLDIYDYKTVKEMELKSYVNWEGKSKKLNPPLGHLDDCNFYEYALQLSIYMYMALRHNRKLKPGKMILEHIIFELEGMDEYGFPINKLDADKNPIVKDIVEYEVPYLKNEVINMINYKKEHPELFLI